MAHGHASVHGVEVCLLSPRSVLRTFTSRLVGASTASDALVGWRERKRDDRESTARTYPAGEPESRCGSDQRAVMPCDVGQPWADDYLAVWAMPAVGFRMTCATDSVTPRWVRAQEPCTLPRSPPLMRSAARERHETNKNKRRTPITGARCGPRPDQWMILLRSTFASSATIRSLPFCDGCVPSITRSPGAWAPSGPFIR